MSSSLPTTSQPLAWVEVLRGLAISSVVLIHVSGRLLREVPQDGLSWWLLATINRLSTFAVPAFLTLSTLLLGLSLQRGALPKVYVRTRFVSLVWPFLLWTVVFLALRVVEGDSIGGTDRLGDWFVWGKASFHLYYLAVVLQLAVLMPALFALTRRFEVPWLVLGGVALTVAVYSMHRLEPFLPFPGSSVLWYLPSVTLGLCLLSKADNLEHTLRRWRPWALVFVAAGLAVFLPPSLQALRGQAVDTIAYQFGHWTFTTAATLVLASLSVRVMRTRIRGVLEVLGRNSLQIYLCHPLVLVWLHDSPAWLEPLSLPPALLLSVSLALLVPLGLAVIARRSGVSKLWFGR